ncbi:MAG: hypothetical protein LBH98_01625 [Chitinispirillales bacterium]|jgi:hypothetical protein|nr:hypothetical protein [Chitinispirillales bacterium]
MLKSKIFKVMAAIGIAAGLVSAQTVWDGTTDITWYTANTSASTYTITTAEQLAGLAALVNNTAGQDAAVSFQGKTITLGANIVLNDVSDWEDSWGTWATAAPTDLNPWIPIGTTAVQQFQGTLDGAGYVVSGVYINTTSNYKGLFGYVHENGKVKDIGITASYVKGSDYTGSLVGHNGGVVSNSYNIGSKVTAGNSDYVGGLVGYLSGSINNCYSTGLVTGGGTTYGGGLVGYLSGGTVSNSYHDTQTSGKTNQANKGEGKTTVEMQTQAFVDGLNFVAGRLSANEWEYNNGNYPTLKHQTAADPLAGKFDSGSGTEESPYIIKTAQQLKNLSEFADKTNFNGYYFKLGQDITSVGSFTAIGSGAIPFNANFDGDNKFIDGVSIDEISDYQGLFGYVGANFTLKNLNVNDSEIKGKDYVGGLVGYIIANVAAKIDNCSFSGAVEGTGENVGGLAGFNGGTITGSHSAGTVIGTNKTGGLAGVNGGTVGSISGSYSASTVTGESYTGGLVGQNQRPISASYSSGVVNGFMNVGGLVGENSDTINNSHSTGNVIGENEHVGGLAGTNNKIINNSYSTSTVTGVNNVGGLVGRNTTDKGVIQSGYSAGKVEGSGVNVGGLVGNNSNVSKIVGGYYDKTVNNTLSDPRQEGKFTPDMKTDLFVRELNSISAMLSMNKWVIDVSVNNGYPTISNDLAEKDIAFFFESGAGTQESPYIIKTSQHLKNLSFLVDFGNSFQGEFLKLGNNIELNSTENWTPIGTYNGGGTPVNKPFNGTFDGDNKTVKGVFIDNTSINAQGLFGALGANGTIKNLGVIESSVKGSGANIGGLAGYTASGAKIDNCFFNGAVIGTGNFTGGLVGFNGGAINNSYSAGTVNGAQYTGGLAGGNQPGTIIGSYSISTVTGTNSVGGLVGRHSNSPGIIDNSYSTGTVNGNNFVGGLVGENSGPIKNSYSTGAVKGNADVGGLVGGSVSTAISNSYSTGEVEGITNVGGFAGRIYGTNSQTNSSYSVGELTGTISLGGLIGNYSSCNSCMINSAYYNNTVNSSLDDPRNEGKSSQDMKKQDFADELNIIASLLSAANESMNKWVVTGSNNDGYPTLSKEVATADLSQYFASGNGTETTPYLITTAKHLENLSWLVDFGINFQGKFVKLGNDIALNDTENWENWNTSPPANSWTRIGTTDTKAFQGTFDGNGKVVSGMYYYTSGTADRNGLFGALGSNGTIKNLGVTDSYISCGGSTYWVGGIVGDNYGTVSNCYSTAWLSAQQYVGGLVGRNQGTVFNSYSTGKVNGTSNIGGFVGQNYYSASSRTGRIENCYSTGAVTGTGSSIGGFVGNFVTNSIITNSYYDKTVNSALTDSRSEGKYTDKIKLQQTFIGWDFEGVWKINPKINDGYPHLQGFTYVEDHRSFEEICIANDKVWDEGCQNCVTDEERSKEICASTGGVWETKIDKCRTKIDWYDEKSSPFTVSSVRDLQDLEYLVNEGIDDFADKTIRLSANIALSGNWTPIGISAGISFRGTFDGQGKTISGLSVNSAYAGLFGHINDATIKNVKVNTSAEGIYSTKVGGILAGVVHNALTVENVYVSGNIFTDKIGTSVEPLCLGGLVGQAKGDLTLKNSHSKANVSCSPTSGQYVSLGGLVGYANKTLIVEECFAGGDISGYANNLGGLIGYADDLADIKNCYAKVNVNATNSMSVAGGFVGEASEDITIENSYFNGIVDGGGYGVLGAIIGMSYGDIAATSVYYDNSIGTGAIGYPDEDIDGISEVSANSLKTQATFVGWNWDDVWKTRVSINDGFPYLKAFENTYDIKLVEVNKPALVTSEFTFNSSPRIVSLNPTNDALYTLSGGDIEKTNAGNYIAVVTLTNTDDYKWKNEDAGVASFNLSWKIDAAQLDKPALVTSEFTFDGNPHTVALNVPSVLYTLGGDVTKIDAGNYTATVTLTDPANYKWIGSDAASFNLSWKIDDAADALSPTKSKDGKYGVWLEKAIVSDAAKINVRTPQSSRIKIVIVDNLGNIVFEANGGNTDTFEWRLTNNAGRFVANGTYLMLVEAKAVGGKVYTYSTKIGVKR